MSATHPPYFFVLGLLGVIADQPDASTVPQDTLYWSTDTTTLYISDGSAWNEVAGGGGGGSWPTYSGDGSPVGVVSATAVGQTYADTTNGAVWISSATGDTGWVSVGGYNPAVGPGNTVLLDADTTQFFAVWDPVAENGFYVVSAAEGGTPNPQAGVNSNVLDDGNGNASVAGTLNAGALGAAPAYVTVQAGAPVGPYQTPLVFDTTSITGGLYAWDGSAYQEVGGPI